MPRKRKRRLDEPEPAEAVQANVAPLDSTFAEPPTKRRKKSRKKPRPGRGLEAQARRLEKYINRIYENSRKKINELTVHKVLDVPFPSDFAGWSKNGRIVTAKVAKHWPTPPKQLPLITDDEKLTVFIKAADPTPEQLQKMGPGGVGIWLVRNSRGQLVSSLNRKEFEALEADGLPPWLAIRLAHIIPLKMLDELLARWDHLVSMGLKFPKADPNRSRTAAVHLGVWGLFGSAPRITADSRQMAIADPVERAAVIKAMDRMLWYLKKKIIPKIENALDEVIPEHVRLQDRLRAHAQRLLRKEFKARPALNFGGLFFTVAIKEGSSERIHVDWNDCPQKYALIFCAGNYVGADFCIPQLNIRIPLGPGSVLAVRTRLLAHCATPIISGRRVVFTCFTDNTYMESILKGRDFAVIR
ncbi:hypothetical protein C8R46DRAFT_1220857 [Mycena filopes]|nr:hypothetical protein C8R46DRAFT_1220857 [Mycena filopes]